MTTRRYHYVSYTLLERLRDPMLMMRGINRDMARAAAESGSTKGPMHHDKTYDPPPTGMRLVAFYWDFTKEN